MTETTTSKVLPVTRAEAMREAAAQACEAFGKDHQIQWGDRKRFELRDLQRVVRDVARLCAEDVRALPVASTPITDASAEVRADLIERARDMLDARGIGPDTLHGTWVGHEDVVQVVAAALASSQAPAVDSERLREALKPFAAMANEMERVAAQHSLHPSKIGRSHNYDDCVAARAALTSTSAESENSAAIPAGWVLVPREPTEAMLDAYYEEQSHGAPAGGRCVWSAMLSASPSQEQSDRESGK